MLHPRQSISDEEYGNVIEMVFLTSQCSFFSHFIQGRPIILMVAR
jgi:hypothetical protein